MSRIGTIARRTFLIGSAATAGGVAFGVYAVRKPHANPLLADLGEGEATFNPWVKVSSEGITLITPHADKGQGVMSVQAALIAEEMDLEWGQFETTFGTPSAAYYNTGMADEAVPFMSTDDGRIAETMRTAVGGVMKLVGMQGTGGSTSVPDTFQKLRMAGAVARETLKLAAAQANGLDASDFTTEAGAVVLPGGTRIAYTELAGAAAGIEPVQDVVLRDPSDWRILGKPMERLDIVAKSTGAPIYGIDKKIDGMVHAAIRVNPRQGGAINGFDASAAEALRGVQAIVPITGGVAVVADNTWRAMQAVNAIEIDWGAAPYPDNQDAHWEALANAFDAERLDKEWRNDGAIEDALGGSEVIEATYRSPYVAHAPLEPLNAIVQVHDDAVDVWTGHQMPQFLQQAVGRITGHDPDQVRFHNAFMGGSFGHRLELEYIKQATEIAMTMPGTPVKLTYSREEDFAHDYPRHISMGVARGRVADGRVEAIDLHIASPSVIGSQMGRAGLSIPGPDSQIAAGAWNNPYAVPNFRVCAYRADELAPVSSWRSVGAPGAGFMFDSFLDELIHAAGADPMAERIRLMEHEASRKVLEAVAEMSDWGAPLEDGQGKGVAFVESFGVPVAEVVQVRAIDGAIRVEKVWAAADVGVVVDPVNFENLVQGGVVFGLGHAMNCEITYADGMAEQSNFHAHEGMRMYNCPVIEVRGLENGRKVRGIGEPPVPPAAPALANAIFAATGQRIRELPLYRHVDFV